MAILNWLFSPSFSEDEQKLIDALKENNMTSQRVVGRGTLVVDVKEVRSSPKFQEYARRAKQIVDAKSAEVRL